MRAGTLRYSITFFDRTDQSESDYGSVDATYAQGITCRAKIQQLSGSETIQSDTLVNKTVIQVTIRYRSGLSEKSYITLESEKYAIEVIENRSFKGETILTCSKIVDK